LVYICLFLEKEKNRRFKMKKFICLFLMFILLVGCGKIKELEVDQKKKDDKIVKYSLVSTEERLVFKKGDNYEIVYYENEKIVKVESAIKFESEELAKKHYKEESYGSSENIKYIYDTYIIEQLDDYWEDYKDLDKEELKKYFQEAGFELV